MLRSMGTSTKITQARRILAANLLRVREELGLSQEAFAEKLGFHRTYISSVERCQRNVSIDNLDKMAKALKVRAAELLAE
jgi:transcriptional regulator with XRE-family HTH domain